MSGRPIRSRATALVEANRMFAYCHTEEHPPGTAEPIVPSNLNTARFNTKPQPDLHPTMRKQDFAPRRGHHQRSGQPSSKLQQLESNYQRLVDRFEEKLGTIAVAVFSFIATHDSSARVYLDAAEAKVYDAYSLAGTLKGRLKNIRRPNTSVFRHRATASKWSDSQFCYEATRELDSLLVIERELPLGFGDRLVAKLLANRTRLYEDLA